MYYSQHLQVEMV